MRVSPRRQMAVFPFAYVKMRNGAVVLGDALFPMVHARPACFRSVSFQLCFFYVPSPEAPRCCVGQVNRRYRSGCSRICYCRACSLPAAHHGSTCLPPHGSHLPGNTVNPCFSSQPIHTDRERPEGGRGGKEGGWTAAGRHTVGRGGGEGTISMTCIDQRRTRRSIATSHTGREEG